MNDPRMSGAALKNLQLFESLCGDRFETVVLTTTMWDEVDENEGATREKQLKDGHWKPMIDRGWVTKRFIRTPQSAFEILTTIFNKANSKTALLLQTEMNDLGLQLRDTSAGEKLHLELQKLISLRQKSVDQIKTLSVTEQKKPEQLLLDECDKFHIELDGLIKDLDELQDREGLKITSLEHIRKAARRINWSWFFRFVITYACSRVQTCVDFCQIFFVPEGPAKR